MKVKYTGDSDFQIFDAADFKKAELEGRKTVFAKDQSIEVDDAIGDALTSDEGLFGPYSFEKVEEDESSEAGAGDDLELDLDADAPLETSGKGAITEGTLSATTTSSTKSTGKGSSTRAR